MKNIRFKSILFTFLFCIIVISSANVVLAASELESITYTGNVNIVLGDSYQIQLSAVPSDASLSGIYFESSNREVAEVSQGGIITTYSVGETTITLSDGNNVSEEINVRVIFETSGFESSYYPSAWNGSIMEKRSSYAYALDILSSDPALSSANGNYFFLPGEIANLLRYNGIYSREADFYDISQVIECVRDDICALSDSDDRANAIYEIGINEKPTGYRYKIMLFADVNISYTTSIWFRQNPNGTWSYKAGAQEVSNVDKDGNLIYNPITSIGNISNTEYKFKGCYSVESMD